MKQGKGKGVKEKDRGTKRSDSDSLKKESKENWHAEVSDVECEKKRSMRDD